MKHVTASFLVLLIIVSLWIVPVFSTQTSGLIFIRADGSIEGTNKIHRSGNTYIFAGDIDQSYGIIVEKSDIIIDGKGHTLKSTPRILPIGSWDFGIELSNVTSGNVIIKNLKIVDFNIGVYIWTTNNTVTGNTIIGGNVGIFLAETPNTVVGNHIEDNTEGVFLGPLPDTHKKVYNILYHNSFVNNTDHVYDCECTDPHTIQHLNIWDNGTSGNYWSNYTGVDADGNGIGDTPHQISGDDVDVCPLMAPLDYHLNTKNGFLGTDIPLEIGLTLTAGATTIIFVIAYVIFKRRKS
jgi:nitrous oxidase accessory protein NosD